MKSAIYQGSIRHRRFRPKQHYLKYDIFMMYLDLDEIDQVLALSPLWSTKRWRPARFKRSDFFGSDQQSLRQTVCQRILQEQGVEFNGSIRMLANLRYFGFIMNPIACYYCFEGSGENEQLKYIVADVNNTPWGERHSYVLCCDQNKHYQQLSFAKQFHVSPFNPMDIEYQWRSDAPEQKLRIHMQNIRKQEKEFDSTLVLQRKELNSNSLNGVLIKYPVLTLKIFLAEKNLINF